MASLGRGSGGFVDPAPEELLNSCRLAGRGKESMTAFTICGILSVVNGSSLLHFCAGKNPKISHSCHAVQHKGVLIPLCQQFAFSRFAYSYMCSYRRLNSNSHYSEVSRRQCGCIVHALLILIKAHASY